MVITKIESELGSANRHQSSVGNVSGLVSSQVWEAGWRAIVANQASTWGNSGWEHSMWTLRGRVFEVGKTLSCREVDVCCVQETRYYSSNCHTIKDKDTRYKLYWSGNDKGTAGVGVFVVEVWIEKVLEVQRICFVCVEPSQPYGVMSSTVSLPNHTFTGQA